MQRLTYPVLDAGVQASCPLLKSGELYKIYHGDTIPHLYEMPKHSVDMAICSPPFPAIFSYTSSQQDIGNSENLAGDGKLHLSFWFNAMRRVIKPGRVFLVHCWQIPNMKRVGGRGLIDFRGLLIRLGKRAGFDYEYDWMISHNPQMQALRTRSRELQFAGLESDRARSRGELADYIIKFMQPGENQVKLCSKGQVSRNDWIAWAESSWRDIRPTDTLNVREGKGKDDTRHICALQLDLITRYIRLFSDPGEIVFDPFAGIGSVPYCALRLGRRSYGSELKDEYHTAAVKNCERALKSKGFMSEQRFFNGNGNGISNRILLVKK